MITVKLLKDSRNPARQRLSTFVVTYPRFIHAEIMTHRMLSKNSASSRAIPAKKMREAILAEPATPEWWGKNQSGMQAEEELTGFAKSNAQNLWSMGLQQAVRLHVSMTDAGSDCSLHKQIANRVLEPWMHITVLLSGTDFHNFFALRAHPAAQPEFQVLAYRMLDCYLKSQPQELDWGQWHIPFEERMPDGLDLKTKLKIATARAARLSYLTFEGEINVAKDIELHDSLVNNGHMSPTEHVAYAEPDPDVSPGWPRNSRELVRDTLAACGLTGVDMENALLTKQGNFSGFKQYRKLLPNENRTNVDLQAILAAKPDWVQL